jgi:hypothetical protein
MSRQVIRELMEKGREVTASTRILLIKRGRVNQKQGSECYFETDAYFLAEPSDE